MASEINQAQCHFPVECKTVDLTDAESRMQLFYAGERRGEEGGMETGWSEGTK